MKFEILDKDSFNYHDFNIKAGKIRTYNIIKNFQMSKSSKNSLGLVSFQIVTF